jgi:hypothetical protein
MAKTEETTSEDSKSRTEPEELLKHPPVIVDLGLNSRLKIERLKKCTGPLYQAVAETVDILQTDGVVAKTAQVVIVVVEQVANPVDAFHPRAWY